MIFDSSSQQWSKNDVVDDYLKIRLTRQYQQREVFD